MRILIAHNITRVRNGGASRIMGYIHDHIVDAGHQVDYFCSEDVPANLKGRKARFAFPLLILRHAAAAAREGKPYDIINVHEPSAVGISFFKRFAGNPKIVVTSHGVEQRGWNLLIDDLRNGFAGPKIKTRLAYPLTSLWQSNVSLRRADHTFCLNSEDRDYLVQRFGIDESKITRIYPAASELYAVVAQGRTYEKFENLLFAGTWLTRKGIDDVIASFTMLTARYPNLRLIVLGGGVPGSVIRDAFPEAVQTKVITIQSKSDAETAKIFARADAYLLPSLFEGTPLTLMEAMASGLPIITTAVCGMKDVIKNNQNGLLVPTRSPDAIVEAVEKLISTGELRARLGRNAQAEALDKYTWEKVAIPVCQVYENLVHKEAKSVKNDERLSI